MFTCSGVWRWGGRGTDTPHPPPQIRPGSARTCPALLLNSPQGVLQCFPNLPSASVPLLQLCVLFVGTTTTHPGFPSITLHRDRSWAQSLAWGRCPGHTCCPCESGCPLSPRSLQPGQGTHPWTLYLLPSLPTNSTSSTEQQSSRLSNGCDRYNHEQVDVCFPCPNTLVPWPGSKQEGPPRGRKLGLFCHPLLPCL